MSSRPAPSQSAESTPAVKAALAISIRIDGMIYRVSPVVVRVQTGLSRAARPGRCVRWLVKEAKSSVASLSGERTEVAGWMRVHVHHGTLLPC